ncbi:MAG: putative oxidoreductase [Rhodospirillales bacterium]|nr:putative oxidoreductase [Rhodospirillales bacterium]
MNGSLAGQTFIVTGASRGIGLASAKSLGKRGGRVALFGRDEIALAQAANAIGNGALPVPVDVADRKALIAAIDWSGETFGGLDGIVNNAGLSLASRIEALRPQDVATQVNVNFLGAVYGCQAVIPHFRKRGGGRIVNVGSASVRHLDEFAYISIYSATKAALERFTIDLRDEVKAENIGVTLFSPGGTETAFGSGWEPEVAAEAFGEWLRRSPTFDGTMAADTVGEAIAACFELPAGSAFDFVEIRPNKPMSRQVYAETLYAARRDNP